MTAQPAPVSIAPDQPVPAEFDLLCESCGYSLVGLMVERCPECGQPFDATQLPLARVPWLYRKRLGRVGAYVQTLRLALLSPRAFAAELCRPVRISAQGRREVRLPGGTWIECRQTCSNTLRQETIDFWYIRSNPYYGNGDDGPGYFNFEFGW